MTSTRLRPDSETRPLVAVLCSVPLLGEAMVSALEFAEVRSFAQSGGDVEGLLGWLRPDALIVDSSVGAEAATSYAREHDLPLVHVSVRDRTLHLFRAGKWEQVSNGDGPTPEAIRNVVAGSLFARGGPVR
jgi:hypothetical protein